MFRLVTEQVGQEPIIIDADDLLKQPGVLFHLQCFVHIRRSSYEISTDLSRRCEASERGFWKRHAINFLLESLAFSQGKGKRGFI